MKADTVEVPIPPSANHLWRSVTVEKKNQKIKVIKTEAYTAWMDVAVLTMRCGLSKVRAYPVGIRVTVVGGAGWRANRDLSNAYKAVEDAVRHAGIIEDDNTRFVRRVEMEFVEGGGKAKCLVTVFPLPAEGGAS